MRYIGNKTKLLNFLRTNILSIENIKDCNTFIDVFGGTGSVCNHLKNDFEKTIACDMLYCSYVSCYSKVKLECVPEKSENYINKLNELKGIKGFIYEKYSEGGSFKRLYFSKENGMKIDAILVQLEKWKSTLSEEKLMYLKYVFLEAVSKVSNTTGVYGAFLKKLTPSANKKMVLENIYLNYKKNTNEVYCGESYQTLKDNNCFHDKAILYLDPPYNSRQYSSNYHLLDTIAQNKDPEIKIVRNVESKTGMPVGLTTSNWCSSKKVLNELKQFLETSCAVVVMSYNNESLVNKEELVKIMEKYGTTKVIEKVYKKYKSNKKKESKEEEENEEANCVKEYLFICDKRSNEVTQIKPVIQWVGGKRRILPKIKEYIPKSFNTKENNYFELFLGGGSLLFNICPKNAYCCEINVSVYTMYSTVRNHSVELIHELKEMETEYLSKKIVKNNDNPLSRSSYYYDIRKKFNTLKLLLNNKNKELTKEELVTFTKYFMFMNKTGFNGMYRENRKGELSIPFGNGKDCTICNTKEIEDMAKYLNINNVMIYNKDFGYLKDNVKKGDLVYLDPPYHNTFVGYDKNGWNMDNTKSVIKMFLDFTKKGVHCLFSNNNNEEFKTMVKEMAVKERLVENKDFKMIELQISRTINSNANDRKKKNCELLIVNCF